MESRSVDYAQLLEYIDPAGLTYQEWVNVGMALKHEGCACTLWDDWSRRDISRYHDGECASKWAGFLGSNIPVTGATITALAKDGGWRPNREDKELGWDDVIGTRGDNLVIVNPAWFEGKELAMPEVWHPAQQLIEYLETLFSSDDNVGYVTRSYEKDGRHIPSKGCWDRTAGQLIEQLSKCSDDVGAVLGDYNDEVGAWIRFNPLDGKGVKNENVAEFRYALVESDSVDIERQNAIIHELELPVAALVHSGNKSLHAIVRIDAADYGEYRNRVDYLYSICKKNGLDIDTQNRNPSRLSRMPGVIRNGQRQYLLGTNIGKTCWAEWVEWIEAVNDDLPDQESLSDVWNDLPELAPPLIDGVLRQGHKMLLAGPSKAGKSFALIELCCAIAEGNSWLGFNCAQGKVLYVNLELDRASCLHRFKDVYTALRWTPENISNIDIWNLRGKSVPMDKLAPKLIRRASKKGYIAIIIDPIYKIITGDENSADQMAAFCNQFDKVCTELGCAVIYCHHHSKGAQGGKRSMDRASGSGVFARDPDALLDLIELELEESVYTQEENKAAAKLGVEWLHRFKGEDSKDYYSQDDACSGNEMLSICRKNLPTAAYNRLCEAIAQAKTSIKQRTAWRIEGTLREFPKFPPVNIWFDYPIHTADESGVLSDVNTETAGTSTWKSNFSHKKTQKQRTKERSDSIETAFSACAEDGRAQVADLAGYLGVTERTVRNRLKEHGGFWIDDSTVGEKK